MRADKPPVKPMPTERFKLRQLFDKQRDKWLLAGFLAVITALSVIGLLMISGWFISAAAIAGIVALGSHSFNYMVPAAIIRVLAMVRSAGRYGEMMVSHHAIFGLLQQLRVRFFNQFARLPLTSLAHTLQSTQAMHRLTHDIDVLNELPLRVVSPWLTATTAMGLVATFIYYHYPKPWLVGLFVVGCLLLPAMLTMLGVRQAPFYQISAEARRVSLLNPLSALTHLLIWQRWDSQLTGFNHFENDHNQQLRWMQCYQSATMLLVDWLIASVVIGLIWYFYHHPLTMSVPKLLALLLGVLGIADLLSPLVTHYLALGNSLTAKNKLNTLLDNPSQQHDSLANLMPLATELDELLSHQPLQLTVTHLNAKMPQAIVGFSDVTFTASQAKPLLITGRSGAGKSTLLQVLAHELTPTQGTIKLNGINWLTLNQSPNLFGYLGQQIDIFDQTLATNLRLGKPDATDDELWQVLDKVGLKDWAQAQPQQLATPLGEYGQAISGGQARRVALGRLLLTPKKILLLDEPFAGLDKDTRESLWQQLIQHQRQGILIIVTHHVWQMAASVDLLHLSEPSV